MTLPLALLAALCAATLIAPFVATPRGLFLALYALACALDAAAVLCGAAALAVTAAAHAVRSPFLGLARACLRASDRISSGRAP